MPIIKVIDKEPNDTLNHFKQGLYIQGMKSHDIYLCIGFDEFKEKYRLFNLKDDSLHLVSLEETCYYRLFNKNLIVGNL